MNDVFVYRGILVLFDKLIGWFFYDGMGNKFTFQDKETCKDFINSKLN